MYNNHKCHWQCFDLRLKTLDYKIEKFGRKVGLLLSRIECRGGKAEFDMNRFKELVASKEVYQLNHGYPNMGRG